MYHRGFARALIAPHALISLFLMILNASSSFAQDTANWRVSFGDWNTPANWDCGPDYPHGCVPTLGTLATIGNNGTANLDGDATPLRLNIDAGGLSVGSGGSLLSQHGLTVGRVGLGTLTIQSSGSVNSASAGFFDVVGGGAAGAEGMAIVSDPGSKWTSWTINIGFGSGGQGLLTIQNGGAMTSGPNGSSVGALGGTGTTVVTGAGSQWSASSVSVGTDSGIGSLTISDGGAVTTGAAYIGVRGGTGTTVVTGAGSLWSSPVFAVATDASGSVGSLTISNGGIVNSVSVYNAGTLMVGDGSTLNAGGGIYTQSLAGTTSVIGSGTLTAGSVSINGGTLAGTGTISGFTTIATNGTLLPGLDTATPGTLSFSTGSLGLNGTLSEVVTGTSFGVVIASGDLTLDSGNSILQISQDASYDPPLGTTLVIMTANTPVTGKFHAIQNAAFSNGSKKWVARYNQDGGNNVELVVVANFTVFTVHGLFQSSSDLQNLVGALEDRLDSTRFTVDGGFDFSFCANNRNCDTALCTIQNGAKLLAQYVNQQQPAGSIALIGYSLGGLIARDMILNNYYDVVTNHDIAALITLGSPHLGYPYEPIDGNVACNNLVGQMFGDYRNDASRAPPLPPVASPARDFDSTGGGVALSNYLFDLNTRWESGGFTRPDTWLAAAGSACPSVVRSVSIDRGCPDGSRDDGVVCNSSAAPFINNGPDQLFNDDLHLYSHTSSVLSIVAFCPGHPPSLDSPPEDGDLMSTVVGVINGLPGPARARKTRR